MHFVCIRLQKLYYIVLFGLRLAFLNRPLLLRQLCDKLIDASFLTSLPLVNFIDYLIVNSAGHHLILIDALTVIIQVVILIVYEAATLNWIL